MDALEGFTKRIIVSDGGPGHFKVYKTQFWMSNWASELYKKFRISTEWNMYFANLGHNLCDGHAGKMKVYVRIEWLGRFDLNLRISSDLFVIFALYCFIY